MRHDDKTRRKKLQGLLERLKQRKNVQNRDLQTWLGADGYAEYEAQWAAQLELRDELANKPDAVCEYERRLKAASFAYRKADAASQRGRHDAAKKLFGMADGEFERLLEFLSEIMAGDTGLRMWFDREIDLASYSLTPSSVPQVVTSKGHENQGRTAGILQRKQNKHQVKIAAVEHALAQIEQRKQGVNVGELVAKRKARAVNVHPERDSD